MATLILRTDSDSLIGTGHVMRCLALAQAWKSTGGDAVFLSVLEEPALRKRLEFEGFEVVRFSSQLGSADDAEQTVDFAQKKEAEWIVIDGYHFREEYQRILKASGRKVLFIDDYGHAEHYCTDIVLNQNIYADDGLYKNREENTRLLLGTSYALLRKEFLKYREFNRGIPKLAKKVLVTPGGSDPDNVTLVLIRILAQLEIEGLEAVVVVGGANKHYGELISAAQNSKSRIRLETGVTDMAKIICWADVAVSGGGSTCWELAFLGLPNIILVLAENQSWTAKGLNKAGVSLNLGNFRDCPDDRIETVLKELILSEKKRSRMSLKGRKLVDGLGAGKVVHELLQKNVN